MAITPQFNPPTSFVAFETFRKQLMSEKFKPKSISLMTMGVERCAFEASRLRKLIEVAEGVEGTTIAKRIPTWKNRLRKAEENRERLRRLCGDGSDSDLRVTPPPAWRPHKDVGYQYGPADASR